MFSVGSIGAIGRGSARSLDALWRLAGFTPSFDFPFARNRSLVNAVTGQSLIAYTQAFSGTYVNSDRAITTAASNEPRFDHDPTTGESLGLLAEGQQTNLLLRSEEFNDASWIKDNSSITANTIAAPTGTISADSLIESNTAAAHSVSQTFTAVSGTAYTISVFAKSLGGNRAIKFRFTTTAWTGSINTQVDFDLTTGAGTAITGLPTFTSQAFPNGWWRFSMTTTSTANGTPNANAHLIESVGSSISYTGDGASGIYLWGVQLEAESSPTSYIPTGASSVTRSASLADLIGSAIANNIRSFYVEFRSPAVGTRGVVSLNDNTANNRAAVITSGTDPRLVVHSGGVAQANINGGTVTAGARTRVAVRIDNNDFAISINGAAVVTDTSGVLPIVDRIMIGRTQAGEFLNSRIARFTGWNQLLSDATLRSLSSQ